MDDQTKTALHICNDTANKIKAQFHELTVIFVLVHDNDYDTALKTKQNEIFKHPSGQYVWDALQSFTETTNDPLRTTKTFRTKEPHPIPFLSKETSLCGILVSIDTFTDAKSFRHALISAAYNPIKTIITGKHPEDESTKKNRLIADSFAALAMELAGYNNTINEISIEQSTQPLYPIANNYPEQHPFPIAIDAVKILFEELGNEKAKNTPLRSAYEMSLELNETFDNTMLQKWSEFAGNAQLLAWGHYTPEDILGLAVHTCEDPHVRAIAHIVADTTKTKTKMATHLKKHNPFTEEEANARHHEQISTKILKDILSHIEKNKPYDFENTITNLNSIFIKGQPVGWCSPALAKCQTLLRSLQEEAKNSKDPEEITAQIPKAISQQFHNSLQELPWPVIEDVFKMVIQHKRTGHIFTGNSLLSMLKESHHPKIDIFETVFSGYKDALIYDIEAEKKAAYEAEFGGLYLEDDNDDEKTIQVE